MKIITNERLIRRNARIGQISSIVALIILAGGMILSFTRPEYFGISMITLVAGFMLSQIGIFYGNRWGRRPRPDEILIQSLKGLDDQYALFNYSLPVSHLLVGPAGVWVLLPFHQRGTITFEKGRWRQRGGNLYLKIFAQEGLGRPDLEMNAELQVMSNHLNRLLPEQETPTVQAALVFTNDKVDVQAEDAPAPTLQGRKLKDFIRKTAKGKPISMDVVRQIQEALGA